MAELSKNLTRVLTGTIIGVIVLGCLLYGGIALLALLSIFIFVGSKEYVQILKNKGFYPSFKVIICSDIVLAILTYFIRFDLIAPTLTCCSIAAFMWVLFKGRQPYIANASTTILGFIYGGWMPLHLLLLRGINSDYPLGLLKLNVQNEGLGYVVLLFLAILCTDTGCYYFGSKFGKHKLAPTISPKKTIEGAIGGALCAIICALIVGYFIKISVITSLILGFLCAFFAQIGDLCESLIKRDAGVKDSGDLLPGHGGFLDRTDSYVFTIPAVYYYLKYFVLSNQLSVDFVNFVKGFLHAIGF